MVQVQHTQLGHMVVPVHMVLGMVHRLQVAMVAVHRRMVVVMVDMVRLATNKSHCGNLEEVCNATFLPFRWCF